MTEADRVAILDAANKLFAGGIPPVGKKIKGRTSGRRNEVARWPIVSEGLGVAAEDAGTLREHLRKHGCPTDVTPNGNPILTGPEHARRVAQLSSPTGMINKDGY